MNLLQNCSWSGLSGFTQLAPPLSCYSVKTRRNVCRQTLYWSPCSLIIIKMCVSMRHLHPDWFLNFHQLNSGWNVKTDPFTFVSLFLSVSSSILFRVNWTKRSLNNNRKNKRDLWLWNISCLLVSHPPADPQQWTGKLLDNIWTTLLKHHSSFKSSLVMKTLHQTAEWWWSELVFMASYDGLFPSEPAEMTKPELIIMNSLALDLYWSQWKLRSDWRSIESEGKH